jgi:predicted MFS family arabinose efflux permease
VPLALLLRRRPPIPTLSNAASDGRQAKLGMPAKLFFALLLVAGFACCIAMAVPQVHIVAYCLDLGYSARQGAAMLSLMLGFGIVSRLASGWIADRIGGLRTVLLNSVFQALALILFVPFDGLASLYAISILFGMQGGLIPSYAIVIREYFRPGEIGLRVGLVIMATLTGMGLGGWMAGAIFDASGSYKAAFVNGVAWNMLNIAIIAWLLMRARRHAHLGTPIRAVS